jgi:DNA-binding Lrp family transcriptional regulator
MPSSFVLINVESGTEDLVLKEVKRLGVVKEAYVSYGVYDLILKVETATMDELKENVTHKIRSLPGVRSTLTLMMIEE